MPVLTGVRTRLAGSPPRPMARTARKWSGTWRTPSRLRQLLSCTRSGTAAEPLPREGEDCLRRLLAHQLVRTATFRLLDAHLTQHLLPALMASEVVGASQERVGRPVTSQEKQRIFETALRNPPDISELLDPRMSLRIQLRQADRITEQLRERSLVLLRAPRPLLMLSDNGAIVRHAGSTPYHLRPPILPEDADVWAPLAPHLLLVATSRPHGYADRDLTARWAAKGQPGRSYALPRRRLPPP